MKKLNITEIREATLKALGKDADISYITEENLEKFSKAETKEITEKNWQMNGNSLTRYADGHWEWWDDCLAKTKYRWDGNLNSKRLPNCMTGLIQYNMWA